MLSSAPCPYHHLVSPCLSYVLISVSSAPSHVLLSECLAVCCVLIPILSHALCVLISAQVLGSDSKVSVEPCGSLGPRIACPFALGQHQRPCVPACFSEGTAGLRWNSEGEASLWLPGKCLGGGL